MPPTCDLATHSICKSVEIDTILMKPAKPISIYFFNLVFFQFQFAQSCVYMYLSNSLSVYVKVQTVDCKSLRLSVFNESKHVYYNYVFLQKICRWPKETLKSVIFIIIPLLIFTRKKVPTKTTVSKNVRICLFYQYTTLKRANFSASKCTKEKRKSDSDVLTLNQYIHLFLNMGVIIYTLAYC